MERHRANHSPLEASALHVRLGSFELSEVSVAFERGAVTALVGPNGSGKTTLLKALGRLLQPDSGKVLLDGRSIASLPTREVAKRLAFLPQFVQAPAGLTVRELVMFGRYPHRGRGRALREEDQQATDWAIELTEMQHLATREVDRLSGGERQRAWIAMALAQRTGVLLLDEPTSFLDIRHQIDTLRLVRRLNREHGITVGWVLHDLNQAAAYSDRIVALKDGRIEADGPPSQVMQPQVIQRIFDIEVVVVENPVDGSPLFLPRVDGDEAIELERACPDGDLSSADCLDQQREFART
jgi:iron complex transport system ATP-binding protein